MSNSNEKYMRAAIKEAGKALESGDIPVGAVVVKDGEIIASAHNEREKNGVSTHHAEILAIERACRKLGSWRLSGCELYVTLEPCPMCAGAIINSKIDKVVFGAKDPRAGALGSLIDLNSYPLGFKTAVEYGTFENECLDLVADFFKNVRERNCVSSDTKAKGN